MAEIEHKSFFRTHKVLAFLPLVLMGAGVWYFVHGRLPASSGGSAATAPAAEEPAGVVPLSSSIPLPEAYDPQAGLDIQGSPEFKSQVTHALKLVWLADRNIFLFIRKNLSVIRNENKTGFYTDDGRPVAALSTGQAFRSLTWCAGVIAHQAWHAWNELNAAKKVRRAPPLPGERDGRLPEANPASVNYKGLGAVLSAEDRAFAFQLDVLRKVGAPKKETDLVLRRDPRDFTAAHDGSYALNP
ncbi:MAG: hypothetical protein A2081_00740 [Elusimicrobia bacterium GWC2_61_19]|nr:MAG: hypothetical protein A2081_00740 [Elusimicrobia bacterium GWC2_61_19]